MFYLFLRYKLSTSNFDFFVRIANSSSCSEIMAELHIVFICQKHLRIYMRENNSLKMNDEIITYYGNSKNYTKPMKVEVNIFLK